MTSPGSSAGRNALLDTSRRPDARLLGARFEQWARDRLSPELEVRRAAFPDEGGSSYNLLVDLAGADGLDRVVVKLGSPDPDQRIFHDENLSRQARIMELVGGATGLPVPTVLDGETDPRPLGLPFLVLRCFEGRAWPSDPPYPYAGWVLEAGPEARRRMQGQLVEVLARIHDVTEDSHDLAEFRRPHLGATPLAELVGAAHAHYAWGRGGRAYPLVERALEWLAATLPQAGGPGCVTWGDARPGNLLFIGTDVTAVLDWEGAAIGCGEVDLAFVAMMHRYYQERAEADGLPGLPDSLRPDDLWRDYAELSSRDLADPRWFLVLAATRAAAIQVRFLARRYAAGESVPDDLEDQVGVAEILRRLLDTGSF